MSKTNEQLGEWLKTHKSKDTSTVYGLAFERGVLEGATSYARFLDQLAQEKSEEDCITICTGHNCKECDRLSSEMLKHGFVLKYTQPQEPVKECSCGADDCKVCGPELVKEIELLTETFVLAKPLAEKLNEVIKVLNSLLKSNK